ncbi:hypothetical protein CW304_30215 [Bacillus sp. UFRGS-B20]|nr:hypothetical protein CW304_30215 [Bacillus sp. UFRGS-B20]
MTWYTSKDYPSTFVGCVITVDNAAILFRDEAASLWMLLKSTNPAVSSNLPKLRFNVCSRQR